MTTNELIVQLRAIVEAHPEAGDAEVWGQSNESGFGFHIRALGFSKRHHPARMKLED